MNVKSIVKSLIVLNLVAFTATAAAAYFFGKRSATELLDVATYVGLGIGAVGALMFVGSTSGASGSTGIAASAADQPSRIMDALWTDRNSGISIGAAFVLGGVSWLIIAWVAAMFLGFD
jgi:hypothetical protein